MSPFSSSGSTASCNTASASRSLRLTGDDFMRGEQPTADRAGSGDGEVALAPTVGGYYADVVNRLETSPRAEFETRLPIITGS